ncbi:MAG: carbohydrate porin, partial [Planctomycetota bacterium]
SFDDAALYEQQAGVHFLLYEPRVLSQLKNDVVGVALNWARPPQPDARSEYNFEVFYRVPVLPHLDMTLSYQSVIDPAFTREFDHASVFSLRLRTTF